MQRFRSKISMIVTFLALAAGVVHGQAVTATLLGTSSDSSGALLPGTTVTAAQSDGGLQRRVVTDKAGQFQFPDLPGGQYTVTAEHDGFERLVETRVLVVVNTTTRVQLKLIPGHVSETVSVLDEQPLLQTDRADVQAHFDARQVEDLPLYGNDNFQSILNLVPGVTRAEQLNSAFFNAQSSLSARVNGQSKLANNLQIEGIDDNERTGELHVYIPPKQAIQTVDVNTSNYAPEFGRAAGAVINVILKSGTNAFHGEVYEKNRIAALDAKNSFNPGPVSPYVYNYYGGNVGGPIVKNKLFFFADGLILSDHEGQFGTFTLPTMQFRSGDLRAGGTNVYDPATGTSTGTGRTQLSYQGVANVIDPARISPIATKLLALLPALPLNAPLANNYSATTTFNRDYKSFDAKLDWNVFREDRFSVRYSGQKITLYQQPSFGIGGGPAASGNTGNGTQKLYNIAGNYTHPFSPRLLTVVRLGVSHYRNVETLPAGGDTLAADVGITGANIGNGTNGLSTISISGYDSPLLGFNKNYPYTRGETNINFVNNWTQILGRHTLKIGAEIRRIRDNLPPTGGYPQRGEFDYGDGQTQLKGAKTSIANDFASFLLDVPKTVSRSIHLSQGTWRQTYYFGYLQDTWQLGQKLTATYGVRWELYPPPTPAKSGGFANYDDQTNQLLIAGYGSVPKDLGVQWNYRNFAPRMGLAYRASDKVVFRAGFGTSYYPVIGDGYAYNNYPVTQDISYTSLSSYTPAVLTDGKTPVSMGTGFPTFPVTPIPANGIINSAPVGYEYYPVNVHQKTPYVESWNAAVQTALPLHFISTLTYVGNIGVHAPAYFDLNAARVGGLGANGQPEYATFGRTTQTKLIAAPFTTHYDGLQAQLDRRFTNGLAVTTSYTWGKALAYTSDTTSLASINYYIDLRKNYGRPSFDRSHTFVSSTIYELPFGKGKPWLKSGLTSVIAGGWQVSGVVTLMTGTPLTFSASSSTLNAPGNNQLADINGPFHVTKKIGTAPWFDTSVFSKPAGLILGTSSVGMFAGPGFFNLDASVKRIFPIGDRVSFQFVAEAFGATNTPQYSNPSTSQSSSSFGLVSASSGSRVLQLSGKLAF
jgi:hypothetical protein